MKKSSYKINMLLIPIILLFFICINSNSAFADDDTKPHFPPILENDSRDKEKDQIKSPVKRSVILFKHKGKCYSGILVNPTDATKEKKYPGVLLLQIKDETPENWMDRMSDLSSEGYVVMAIKYRTYEDVKHALRNLRNLDIVDKSNIGVIGVHKGATEAILLAIRNGKGVKCVVSVSGKPPYEVVGEDLAKKLPCPIMFVHGLIDTQVPSSVSQYLYYNCLDEGKKAKIFILQNARHYFNDAEWSQSQIEFLKFLNLYLKGIPDPDEKEEEKKDK
ncbi:MAG: dienelactone hydrolase family protein [Candidatus Eremiobacteraeota bacterium]|nr:dienelactone hydrolase family protein [Candidatus Eremiobacteraeota bacterium]